MNVLYYLNKLWTGVTALFNNVYGSLLIAITFVLNLLMPAASSFATVGVFILMDLICGQWVSIKRGKFIISELWKKTFEKGTIYAFLMISVFLIENLIHDSGLYGIKIIAAAISACELWSMSASLLIINPNLPFLKLLRYYLKDEIEKKLNKNLDSVFDVNDESSKCEEDESK